MSADRKLRLRIAQLEAEIARHNIRSRGTVIQPAVDQRLLDAQALAASRLAKIKILEDRVEALREAHRMAFARADKAEQALAEIKKNPLQSVQP